MSVDTDSEIEALGKVIAAFESLEADARVRIFQFVASRFGISSRPTPTPQPGAGALTPAPAAGANAGTAKFDSFPDLFHAANPQSNAQKALVAGYWFQVCQNAPDFTSQAANKFLKDMGYGIANITAAFDDLKAMKPAQASQVQKGGGTRQARKKYKLTHAGISAVTEMINAGG